MLLRLFPVELGAEAPKTTLNFVVELSGLRTKWWRIKTPWYTGNVHTHPLSSRILLVLPGTVLTDVLDWKISVEPKLMFFLVPLDFLQTATLPFFKKPLLDCHCRYLGVKRI